MLSVYPIIFISNLIFQGRSLASFIQRSIDSLFKDTRKSVQQSKLQVSRRTQITTLVVNFFTVEMNIILLQSPYFFNIYAFIV